MTQLIKATRIFNAALPSAEAMRGHLANEAFAEPLATQLTTCGFVPMEQGTYVTEFPGGYAFRFRIAQKVLPASVIKDALASEIKAIEADTGRKPGKNEKREIKENIIEDLAQQAFVRYTDVIAYFRQETNHLFVPTLSKAVGDKLMTKLVAAVESVKTETIHVSNVTQGLTARLTHWLTGDEGAFGEFYPVNEAEMKQDTRSVKVKMTGLQQARSALMAALAQEFAVSSIGLSLDGDEFKLTDDFKLRSINLLDPEQGEQLEEEPTFEAQAGIEVDSIGLIVDQLVEMFSYKEGEVEA